MLVSRSSSFKIVFSRCFPGEVTHKFHSLQEAKTFNSPLTFNTSNVITMECMFQDAASFNQPLLFDTSSVRNMDALFQGAKSFNQPLSWDTSNVISMDDMFQGATLFNQPLLWDTGNVTSMDAMFLCATSFNHSIAGWNIGSLVFYHPMFNSKTYTQPLPDSLNPKVAFIDQYKKRMML